MTVSIEIDRDRCTSCASCVLSCPDYFDLSDEDALVVLVRPTGPDADLAVLEQAAQDCPTDVISVSAGA
jgi:ferredoxin